MTELFAAVLFGLLGVGLVLWFVLVARLYSALRMRHPRVYAAMGHPTLFLNNTPAHGVALVRFVLGRKYRTLEDPALVRLGRIMFVVFWTYAAVFATLLAAMVSLSR